MYNKFIRDQEKAAGLSSQAFFQPGFPALGSTVSPVPCTCQLSPRPPSQGPSAAHCLLQTRGLAATPYFWNRCKLQSPPLPQGIFSAPQLSPCILPGCLLSQVPFGRMTRLILWQRTQSPHLVPQSRRQKC